MKKFLVEMGHPSPPSSNITHAYQRLAVFDCSSCGKRYCCGCSETICLCEQRLRFYAAGRQGKPNTGGTFVVPHGTAGTTGTSMIPVTRYQI